jgi:hypothetical protein
MNIRKIGIIAMRAGRTVKTNCGESCAENETVRFNNSRRSMIPGLVYWKKSWREEGRWNKGLS